MGEGKFSWGFSLKDIVYIVIIGGLLFFGWRLYKSLQSDIQRSNVAYLMLSETLARAENHMVTKSELEIFAKNTNVNLNRIKADLKKLGADLSAIGQTVASIEGKIEENQDSDSTTNHNPPEQPKDCKLCDLYSYTLSTQTKDINLGEMPFAQVEFDASKAKPWTIKTDDLDVKVTTILGDSGENDATIFYHEIALLNKSRPELLGKEFKLKIVSSEFVETKDNNKEFYFWAPHLDMGISNLITFPDKTGKYTLGFALGLTFMAYGNTKNDNDFRFGRLAGGIDTEEIWFLELDLIQYNLSGFIPLISDLWLSLGPVYNSTWGLGVSIGTTL